MAVSVGASTIVKLIDNVLSEREVTVRNDGPNVVFVSKDPAMAAAGADTWQVAVNATQDVSLAVGEALYAKCSAAQSASVDII